MKDKILVTGIGQANFLNQLFEKVKSPGITIDAVNLKFHSESQEAKSKLVFDNIYNYKFPVKVLDIFLIIQFKCFWSSFLLIFIENGLKGFNQIKSLLARHLMHYRYALFVGKNNYSVINHHFLSSNNCIYLLYLQRSTRSKIMISFWGSDLFRTCSTYDNYIKRQVLNRSSAITVATPEMKYIVCAKYGFDYFDKLFINKFINSGEYFTAFDRISEKWNIEDRKLNFLNVDKQKIVIAYGHSASKEDNYEQFLFELLKCDVDILKRLHILFTLTYGPDKAYLCQKIKDLLQDTSITFTILDEFLDFEELVLYKSCVDAFIFAPVSDALSGNLTEYFYHGIPVFTGAWLPYKEFTNYGIKFYQFNYFSDLRTIINNIDKYLSEDYILNRKMVTKHFISVEEEVANWRTTINTLLK